MSRMSRRAFLSSAGAVTGAAALGAAMAGPRLAAATAGAVDAHGDGPLPESPVVAYVRDPKKGEVAVVVGDREVAVKDAALVRRIVDAAG
jgi:hypothetical protein